jgi:hypothetical protein
LLLLAGQKLEKVRSLALRYHYGEVGLTPVNFRFARQHLRHPPATSCGILSDSVATLLVSGKI